MPSGYPHRTRETFPCLGDCRGVTSFPGSPHHADKRARKNCAEICNSNSERGLHFGGVMRALMALNCSPRMTLASLTAPSVCVNPRLVVALLAASRLRRLLRSLLLHPLLGRNQSAGPT